ncbi:uncharacterized protein N7458_003805, partial [Penicillium daleae]
GLKGLKSKAARADASTNGKKNTTIQDSHVVTHHTTNWPACGLSTAERTGSPVLHTLWSYVLGNQLKTKYMIVCFGTIVFSAAYPVCQVGCPEVFIACYSAAGYVLGATAGAMVPATNIACNASFGKSQGACVLVLL